MKHTNGGFDNLKSQVDSKARHIRQGSFLTRARYREAMYRFCQFLANHFHLQKLANINAKHLRAYVQYLQDQGKAASTIKTELSAIRFFHDQMGGTKYGLPPNDELGVELERRTFGGVDRAWRLTELDRFTQICRERGRDTFADIAALSWHAGLRIHECFRLDTAAAEAVIRTGALTIKGKGGKIRSVPANEEVTRLLRERLTVTRRGHKLFVPDDVPTDQEINRMQQFIASVRPLVQDPGSTRPLTHHGLRHAYAARLYKQLIDQGVDPTEARHQISRRLGHEREEVTKIYLASIIDKENYAK